MSHPTLDDRGKDPQTVRGGPQRRETVLRAWGRESPGLGKGTSKPWIF